MAELVLREERLPPVRGLVTLQNAKGKAFAAVDVMRWICLNRTVYKTDKIDLLATPDTMAALPGVLAYAQDLDVKLSLRTGADEPPEIQAHLKSLGLFDVFWCPNRLSMEAVERWCAACQGLGLPLRVQIRPPFPDSFDATTLADTFSRGGATMVNVTVTDPFVGRESPQAANEGRRTLGQMRALVKALDERDIEANLIGVPLCLAEDDLLPHALNSAQFFLDHQQYHRLSYDLARLLYRRGPIIASKLLLILLAQHTVFKNPVDSKLFPWLAFSPWFNMRVWTLRKLTRHMRLLRGRPKARVETNAEVYERVLAGKRQKDRRDVPRNCAACAWRRICDRETVPFTTALPGLSVRSQPGEVVLDPMRFCGAQRKHYDTVDKDRADVDERCHALAEDANHIVETRTPDRELDSFEYEIEGQWTHQMPGGVRWFSVTNSEKVSTVLARASAPMTLSVTFGGGIADYVGFAFGRHCRLVCPMVEFTHRLVLHVADDGHYILLRDGNPVRPVEFEGAYHVPPRLSTVLEPRISVWNVDMEVVSQRVLLWEGHTPDAAPRTPAKYSILIVSTRYTRRLQAVLRCIAHQVGIDLAAVEVVIAYVPGIDATDDLIDSMQRTHPDLRIVRSPFAEQFARSKGFMINESAKVTSGEWIILLDSDTLIAPNMIAALDAVDPHCSFVAPDGRKMLDKETTAAILLGEIEPWQKWNELVEGGGEVRLREAYSVPIGYCQCVRRECLEKTPYEELEHFEGADWRFGVRMRDMYGREKRLTGVPVLHLDHSGSQWYGTTRHL
jgi:Glycosyltransferase like family 2